MDSRLDLVMFLIMITVSGSVGLRVTSDGLITTFTGESSELECHFSPTSTQGSSYAWSFDGQNENGVQIGTCDVTKQCTPKEPAKHQLVISTNGGTGRMKLIISDAQLSDAGNYTCLVSTSEDAQSALVPLNVTECSIEKPTAACSADVETGSFMDLSCSYPTPDQFPEHFTRIANIYLTGNLDPVIGNAPSFNISVNVNGHSFPNATDVATRLTVTSVCCRIESSLPCQASQKENLCSKECLTNVSYPPSDLFLSQSPSGQWREGLRNASILCMSNGFPSPTVSWIKVDGESSSGIVLANGTGSSTLSFSEVQRNLSGTYRCEADNGMKSIASTTIIPVQYPPVIDRQEPLVHANEGTIASLRCVISANPTPNVTWSTPSKQLLIGASDGVFSEEHSETQLESRLFFTEKVHRDIFGNYTCTAGNALGSDSFVIQLTGHCYPDDPYDLHVDSYSESSLTLSWTSGQDGGLPMTFTVSYCFNISHVEKCAKEQGITDEQFTVDGLTSYTQYKITLLAENDIGTSGNVEIFASTAPGTLEALGISATYEMKSGRLDISSTESDISDLCIHAEFHVGGFRKMNETCLLPGQTVYIRNGAREHQLWLVVCGRGVCSASSPVTYVDRKWSLILILAVTFGCCLGAVLLVLLFIGLYRLTRKRQSRNSVNFDGMSSIQRALPLPPSCALAIGIGSSSFRKDDAEVQNYAAIENVKGKEISDNQHNSDISASKNTTAQSPKPSKDGVFPQTPEGYMQMDAAKTADDPDKGIYTTHLHLGLSGPNQPEANITYGNTKNQKVASDTVDVRHIDVNDETYTVAERNKENGSEYMVPTSPGCGVKDTAL